jgi:hypothetical protein
MKRVLITGMSGARKSSVIEALGAQGYMAIDTDSDDWCEWREQDWVWREDRIGALLDTELPTHLFVSGCKSNQSKFYSCFDHVVLLISPIAVTFERIASRSNNPHGKSAEQRTKIAGYVQTVEPLLRATTSFEINTADLGVEQVAQALLRLVNR